MLRKLNDYLTQVPRNEIHRTNIYNLPKFGVEECSLFSVEQNTEDNRIKLFFEGKPENSIRDLLKSNGWKFAPSTKAWQRQLTPNAIWSLASISKKINEMDKGAKNV